MKDEKIRLSEAIEKMRTAIRNRDLTDGYLAEHNSATRSEIFATEWPYGITVVPCTFALTLAERLLELTGDDEEQVPY